MILVNWLLGEENLVGAEWTIQSFLPRAGMTTTAGGQGNSFLKKIRIKKCVNQEEIERLRYFLEISRI
jgi:hypothetical protein